jgi:KDO2-lipid IV(A) lauroyltransferase
LTVAGWFIGVGTYLTLRAARAAVLRNLSVVVPGTDEQTRRRLAMRTFVHGAWGYLELLALTPETLAAMTEDVSVEGWEHLDAALARGRGVIMVSGHVGTPSTAGQLLALRGLPTHVVVEPLRPAALFQLMVEIRQQAGLRLIPTGPRAVREVLGALRRNEIVGIFGDRDVAGSGETLPFFDRATRMSTAAATLALRTGASIVPCVAYRTRPFQAVAEIWPSIELSRGADPRRDVREGTMRITACLEAIIRRHPEQWAVFSDIWPDASSTMGPAPADQQGSMDRR